VRVDKLRETIKKKKLTFLADMSVMGGGRIFFNYLVKKTDVFIHKKILLMSVKA